MKEMIPKHLWNPWFFPWESDVKSFSCDFCNKPVYSGWSIVKKWSGRKNGKWSENGSSAKSCFFCMQQKLKRKSFSEILTEETAQILEQEIH